MGWREKLWRRKLDQPERLSGFGGVCGLEGFMIPQRFQNSIL